MRVEVRAHPGAKVSRIVKKESGILNVYVKEPPVEGRANIAITNKLSRHFNVNPSEVILVEGAKSRQKIFEVLKKG